MGIPSSVNDMMIVPHSTQGERLFAISTEQGIALTDDTGSERTAETPADGRDAAGAVKMRNKRLRGWASVQIAVRAMEAPDGWSRCQMGS